MAGAVQHGASTLPEELFGRFPEVETAEVHLATGFQNLVMEHPAFPRELLGEMRRYCETVFAAERVAGETDGQFFYKVRKKAWGPFKQEVWALSDESREAINKALEERFSFLIRRLKAHGTGITAGRYVPADGLQPRE